VRQPRPTSGAIALSRREFLAGLLVAGAGAACGHSGTSEATSSSAFPSSVAQYRSDFENWSGESRFPGLRTFAPRTPDDVVEVANWAARNGYALRPRGKMHGWSPLGVAPSTAADTPVVLADTTRQLNGIRLADLPVPAVEAQCGATMDAITAFLEGHGFGFTSMPTTGNITIGGALAVNAHGAAVPAVGETTQPGQTFGSLANRVLALTAVVWDPGARRYVLRRFNRRDPEIGALLTALGRAFITDVTLMVEPHPKLHCASYTHIPYGELLGPPGGGRTLATFLDEAGRVEVLWFAFTDNPWLQVWRRSAGRPPTAREVRDPYNYPFISNFPMAMVDLFGETVSGNPSAALLAGKASLAVVDAGLTATLTRNLWGNSRHVLLWVDPDTLREHRSSWTVLTRRDRVQEVVHEFVSTFVATRDAFQARGQFPVNMPLEVRVTGLDLPSDTGISGAEPALLSALSPPPDHPDWDTAVWMAFSTVPGTPHQYEFAREIEQWAFRHYVGDAGMLRPEWARGWAYTDSAAWADPEVLGDFIPRSFGADWTKATRILDELDRGAIYRNDFLEQLTS